MKSSVLSKDERKELLSLGLAIVLLLVVWCLESLPSDEHQYPWSLRFEPNGLRAGIGWILAAGFLLWRHPRRWGLSLMLATSAVILAGSIGFLWTVLYAFLIVGVG